MAGPALLYCYALTLTLLVALVSLCNVIPHITLEKYLYKKSMPK